MKKLFSIIIVITLIVSILVYLLNSMKEIIPPSLPNIKVTYNKQNIETALGEYNWFDKEVGGNTCFGEAPEKIVKNLKSISAKREDNVNFVFKTFCKQPTKITVNMVIPNKREPYKIRIIKQTSNYNYFNVPKETGEYIFLIRGYWDETHSVEYYFRIKVV